MKDNISPKNVTADRLRQIKVETQERIEFLGRDQLSATRSDREYREGVLALVSALVSALEVALERLPREPGTRR